MQKRNDSTYLNSTARLQSELLVDTKTTATMNYTSIMTLPQDNETCCSTGHIKAATIRTGPDQTKTSDEFDRNPVIEFCMTGIVVVIQQQFMPLLYLVRFLHLYE